MPGPRRRPVMLASAFSVSNERANIGGLAAMSDAKTAMPPM